MICQWVNPIVRMNTTDSVSVTKNSDALTEPIVSRGWLPLATSVVVTIGPQPPPPSASSSPPASANGLMPRLTSRWIGFLRMPRIRMIVPMITR